MAFLIGLLSALGFLALTIPLGFTRERSFYAVVAIVVATYYILFAAISGDLHVVVVEIAIAVAFCVAAIAGYRSHLWIAVAALFFHGVFDAFHGHLVTNPGMPVWWPAFCGTFDVVASAGLALVLRSDKRRPVAAGARA